MDNEALVTENNLVSLAGRFASGFTFSHETFGEKFYLFSLESERLTEGVFDVIPVIVSERLIDSTVSREGDHVRVTGQFRSYNKRAVDDNEKHLQLQVFARNIEILDDVIYHSNDITLNGYICKLPTFRLTPKGREICDLVLAVNRPYGKSDYIPCIVWGRNARFMEKMEVGTKIKLSGRIQSRDYVKKISDEEFISKVAYEVSGSKITVFN